ncbi:unnamed protein product [Lepeophtheirus salmonis]|uniref:(salmon louse) hypothetical protein n=1 Tax=Lepeophtheirus salmonis TaxID=72036 RepID=A0A7R8CIJ9_LEPSM|nr:unnamed protein product [Lepeophtheirus salmonis]CAF2796138.1 unnamed protein product [Lepeophtheirus salmonis]
MLNNWQHHLWTENFSLPKGDGSIVTDNAANVIKMQKLLEESTEHNRISYGSAVHLLNLLAHDLELDNMDPSDCLRIYANNWPILMKICEVDREMTDPTVRSKVSNIGLKRSAEELLAGLQLIAKALDQIQKDNCIIAQIVTT